MYCHQGSSQKKIYLNKSIFTFVYVASNTYIKILTVFMWLVSQRIMKVTDDFDPNVSLA